MTKILFFILLCGYTAAEDGGEDVGETIRVDTGMVTDDLTCPDLVGYPAAVVEACGSDLQALRTVLYLGGGALDLCTDACGKTLTDLAAKAMRCTNEELKPFLAPNQTMP